MFIDFVFVGIFFLLAIPTVTGYFAHCYGLPFWKWFVLGCFLPVIANILLLFIVKNYKQVQKNDLQLTRYEDEYMDQLIGKTLSGSNSFSKTGK